MIRLRVLIWDCLLADRPYREPVADTDPGRSQWAPGAELLPDLAAIETTASDVLADFHGPLVPVVDWKPARVYLAAMAPHFSRRETVNFYTPYSVRSAHGAHNWVVGLCVAREATS